MKVVAPLAALAFAACTAAPPASSLSQSIINGVADDGDPSVVAVFAYIPGQPGAALCTGEVVSPHVVLTAAHCVSPKSVGNATFLIYTGNSLVFDGTVPTTNTLATMEGEGNPSWPSSDTSTDSDPGDIGVVILAEPTGIPPLPYNRFALPDRLIEQQVRIVGYGLTDGNDTAGTTAGTKHSAQTYLNYIRPDGIELWDNEHGTCEGDSGGPAFMMLNGKERIAGVTAIGYKGCPVKLAATDTRVDSFVSFVDGYVDRFDPAPVPPGGACTADTDCGALPCLDGTCTPACDPTAASDSCPAGLACTSVDDEPMCKKPHHGCAFTPGAPATSPAALLFALALLAVFALRRRA